MAVLEMVEPVVEMRVAGQHGQFMPPGAIWPGDSRYDQWASNLSEGWCPIGGHRLEQYVDPDTGETWLHCILVALFRLVYPNQLEDE